jgi:hypothetical protein
MSRSQQILSFVRRGGAYFRVAGKGLMLRGGLSDRFRKMSLGSSIAQKKGEEGEGVIKFHNRPYQLKDTTPKQKAPSKYTSILFKL